SHDRSTSSNREPNELAFLPEESSDASMRTPQSTIDGKRSAYSPTSKSTTSINQRLSDHRLATQQLAGVFQELPRALVAVAVVLGHGRIGEAGDDGVDLVLLLVVRRPARRDLHHVLQIREELLLDRLLEDRVRAEGERLAPHRAGGDRAH